MNSQIYNVFRKDEKDEIPFLLQSWIPGRVEALDGSGTGQRRC